MKLSIARAVIDECIVYRSVVRIQRRNECSPVSILPLATGKRLLLGIVECNMALNGFLVLRWKDITGVDRAGPDYDDALWKAGVLTYLPDPGVRVKNWRSVMTALKRRGECCSVEYGCARRAVGTVRRVGKKKARLECADDRREIAGTRMRKIRLKKIRCVAFGIRPSLLHWVDGATTD